MTAVLASWVTSRGTSRAALQPARVTAAAQQAERQREARRSAYLVLIEHMHTAGGLYRQWHTAAVVEASTTSPTALQALRLEIRENHHGRFLPALHAVSLEGPETVAVAAAQVQDASTAVFKLLESVLAAPSRAGELDRSIVAFWDTVDKFSTTARTARHP
ncbi:hypothetical protein ACIGXI_10105 [Kitasatospora aureofaciens]|uniref:hypothetical protein n=1 Tax=Kitasatospora aureofaciens TaxID=1894 RepID=UPI0037C65834